MAQQRDEFDTPGNRSTSRVNLRDLIGKLVLFSPTEYIPVEKDEKGTLIGGIKTTDYGYKDAVLTDAVVLDADGGPEQIDDMMVFNGKPIGDLKRRVGGLYLARVALGDEKVKGNYPIILDGVNEDDKQMARDYRAGRDIAAATAPVIDDKDPFRV